MKSNIVIGIDEVGRGPISGPVTVAAVALDNNIHHSAFNDSKKLTPLRRERLVPVIQREATDIGIGWVAAPIIDQIGIVSALKLAAQKAFSQLSSKVTEQADRIIIDGNFPMLKDSRVTCMIKADAKIAAVEAASIIAKQARDHYMINLATIYPEYGFDRHMGYGTAAHWDALAHYGGIEGVHRFSIDRVAKLSGHELMDTVGKHKNRVEDTTGREAEQAAADYLVDNGYKIVDRNWKTPSCEVDIIARKKNVLYFVEVKYRLSYLHGSGLDAITPQKLKQMKLGCELYQTYYPVARGLDVRLMVITLSGKDIRIDKVVRDIDAI